MNLYFYILPESPHTMDISIVLEDEKPLSVNEVPDYHEDIHTYLREMEVRALGIQFLYCCLFIMAKRNWENVFKFFNC